MRPMLRLVEMWLAFRQPVGDTSHGMPQELSWGDAALLAVLPNAPSLIHPGKNRDRLKEKRDRLLDKLKEQGTIDAFTCSLCQRLNPFRKNLSLCHVMQST